MREHDDAALFAWPAQDALQPHRAEDDVHVAVDGQ
jgi:hypothetical protein